jgi:hypothetical protein
MSVLVQDHSVAIRSITSSKPYVERLQSVKEQHTAWFKLVVIQKGSPRSYR